MLFIESNDFAMFLFYINMYQRLDKYLLPLFEYIHIGSAVYEEELYLYVFIAESWSYFDTTSPCGERYKHSWKHTVIW